MQVIYLNDCYEKEEAVIRAYGIPCARVNYPFQESEAEIQGTSIFRGPKMKIAAYSEFIQSLEKIGCSALVGLDDFVRISDAIEYSRCFGNYAPKVITFDIKQDVVEIANLLIESDLKYPLFVRSDIESAAKYVGVDACTLRSSDVNDIETVLNPLYHLFSSLSSYHNLISFSAFPTLVDFSVAYIIITVYMQYKLHICHI